MTRDSRDGAARRTGESSDREAPAASDSTEPDLAGPTDTAATSDAGATTGSADPEGGFGRRGWVLVAVVVLSTLVIPGVIYLVPSLLPSLGVPYVLALLVLPLVPAGLLGATAVWSMAASGRR